MKIAAFLLAALSATAAFAHKPSDSYLRLVSAGARIDGSWDIALRDLEEAVGLDDDGDGAITWGELLRHRPAVFGYALARLRVGTAAGACTARPGDLLVDDHADGAYAVLRFSLDCPGATSALEIAYSLLFEIDPSHRGLLRFETAGRVQSAIFSPDRAVEQFALPEAPRGLAGFLRDGIFGAGLVHLLLLLALLLPLVLRRGQPVPEPRQALGEAAKVASLFVVAASITLSLSTLGVSRLPGRLVQPAIALSLLLAALDNLVPVFRRRRWAAAFVFGLLHGFGFAAALVDPGRSGTALAPALLSFNIGVALGLLVPAGLFLAAVLRLRAPGGPLAARVRRQDLTAQP